MSHLRVIRMGKDSPYDWAREGQWKNGPDGPGRKDERWTQPSDDSGTAPAC